MQAIDRVQEQVPDSLPTYPLCNDSLTKEEVASLIDHTLLKLDATDTAVDQLCQEANDCAFKVGESIFRPLKRQSLTQMETVNCHD